MHAKKGNIYNLVTLIHLYMTKIIKLQESDFIFNLGALMMY